MTDPHRLVERVRELTEQDPEDHELKLRDRPPRSQAQRERVEAPPPAPPAPAPDRPASDG